MRNAIWGILLGTVLCPLARGDEDSSVQTAQQLQGAVVTVRVTQKMPENDAVDDLSRRPPKTRVTVCSGVLLGEGLVYYREKFKAPFTHLLDESYWSATAVGLFRTGHRMAEQGLFSDAYALTPKYIREPDAIVKTK